MTIKSNEHYTDNEFEDRVFDFIDIKKSKFINCNFKAAKMEEAVFENCEFFNCNFKATRLNASIFVHSAFINCRFPLSDLFNSTFKECKVRWS
jgi:uncharacterized protein YjbI with pentapeptide repeats